MGECSLDGCPRPSHARGLCRPHARRLDLYGDPLAGQRKHRAPNGAPEAFIAEALASVTDECIDWPFSAPRGYGLVRSRRVSIVVCTAVHGPKPDDMEVCHSCGNRTCINPRHLRWDTHRANVADTQRHGTQVRGESHGNSKLTWATVEEIRWSYSHGLASQQTLADIYGVRRQTISFVVRGKTWRKV